MKKEPIVKSINSLKTLATAVQQSISKNKKGEILLQIYTKPGAKKNKVTDISIECIGIQVAAQPKEGEANAELLTYLQTLLKVRKSDICLERGGKSRIKTIKVSSNISEEDIRSILETELKSH